MSGRFAISETDIKWNAFEGKNTIDWSSDENIKS